MFVNRHIVAVNKADLKRCRAGKGIVDRIGEGCDPLAHGLERSGIAMRAENPKGVVGSCTGDFTASYRRPDSLPKHMTEVSIALGARRRSSPGNADANQTELGLRAALSRALGPRDQIGKLPFGYDRPKGASDLR